MRLLLLTLLCASACCCGPAQTTLVRMPSGQCQQVRDGVNAGTPFTCPTSPQVPVVQ